MAVNNLRVNRLSALSLAIIVHDSSFGAIRHRDLLHSLLFGLSPHISLIAGREGWDLEKVEEESLILGDSGRCCVKHSVVTHVITPPRLPTPFPPSAASLPGLGQVEVEVKRIFFGRVQLM